MSEIVIWSCIIISNIYIANKNFKWAIVWLSFGFIIFLLSIIKKVLEML